MSPVVSVALPVFAVIGVGLLAGRLRLAHEADAGALNRFVFRFAMPAALFGLTARADPLSITDLKLAASYGLAATAVMIGSYFIGKLTFSLSPQEAGAHAFASTLGNAVFLGLPIALSIPGWGEPFVVLMLVEGVFIIALGAGLMAPRGEKKIVGFFAGPFRNPLVVAMAAGLGFSVFANAGLIELAGPAATFIDVLGRAAGPTALFSLGLFLATNPAPSIRANAGRISAIVLMKMAALPALTLGGLYFFGVNDPLVVGAAALFSFVPTGVGAFVMASQYGFYTREAAAAVAVSTAISVATISVVLALAA